MLGVGLESHAVCWLFQTFIPASGSTLVEWEAHTHKDRGSKLSKVWFSTLWMENKSDQLSVVSSAIYNIDSIWLFLKLCLLLVTLYNRSRGVLGMSMTSEMCTNCQWGTRIEETNQTIYDCFPPVKQANANWKGDEDNQDDSLNHRNNHHVRSLTLL